MTTVTPEYVEATARAICDTAGPCDYTLAKPRIQSYYRRVAEAVIDAQRQAQCRCGQATYCDIHPATDNGGPFRNHPPESSADEQAHPAKEL